MSLEKIRKLEGKLEASKPGIARDMIQEELVDAIHEDAYEKARHDVLYRKASEERSLRAARENPMNIRQGVGDEYKGAKVKRVMDHLGEKMREAGAADYLTAKTDGAEYVARFFIDMAHKVQMDRGVTKANELVTTTDNVGGYLTPTEQEEAILDYARHRSVALTDARVIPMTSDQMTVPVVGTVPSVTIEANETTITQATPTFGQATLTTKRHSGYIPVSWELDMDETASLAEYLSDKFVEDLGKTIDSAVFLGPGTLVDGSGLFDAYGVSAVMAAGSTNFSSVYSSIIFETVGKLTPERRAGAKWYCRYDHVWAYLAQLTYGTDMALYNPTTGKLLGVDVRELWTGKDTGADTALAVFGNLKSFIIGSRLQNTGLKKIDEKTGLTNYVFFTRLAYANALPDGIVGLVTAS